MKHLATIFALLFFSVLSFAQSKTTDLKDEQIARQKLEVRSGGILKVAGYEISGISNDPTLADSLNSHLVTEAAAKAFANTKDPSTTNELTTFTSASSAPSSPKTGDIWHKSTTDSVFIRTAAPAWAFLAIRAAGATDPAMGGDLTGTASNAQIVAGAIGATELATGAVDLAGGDVTGVLPVSKGGTGLSSLGTTGQLPRVASGGGFEFFTPSYLTANQTITLTGAVTGSGTTAITTTLGALGATLTGQVLTWNGSSWGAAAPTGGVTGSGTTNYHAKWSGASALTSAMTYDNGSTFFLPTTASRLRIGGTNEFTRIGIYMTPTFTDPSTSVYAMRFTSTVAVSTTEFKGFYNSLSVGSGVAIMSNFGAYLTDPTGAGTVTNNYGIYIEAQTKGTNNYSLYSLGGIGYHEGNLGVGTPSPSQKLHVVGKAVISDQVLFSDGTAALPGGSFANDTNTGVFRPTTDVFAISTGGAERVRLDASGNVGIGTTTPGFKLDVNGSLNLKNDGDFFGIAGQRIFEKNGTRLDFGEGITTIFFRPAGNVGINNMFPTEKLDVTGNVRFSGALMPGGSAGTTGQFLISQGSGAAPIWGSETDGSVTNEGALDVAAGATNTSVITTNTSGSAAVTLKAGTGVSLSETADTITIAVTSLTGSGSTGKIPKWSSSSALTDSATEELSEGRQQVTLSTSANTSRYAHEWNFSNTPSTPGTYKALGISYGAAPVMRLASVTESSGNYGVALHGFLTGVLNPTPGIYIHPSNRVGINRDTASYGLDILAAQNVLRVESSNNVATAVFQNTTTGTTGGYISQAANDMILAAPGNIDFYADRNNVLGVTVHESGAFIFKPMSGSTAAAITPSAGMVVFVTNSSGAFTSAGFWGYDGTSWSKLN